MGVILVWSNQVELLRYTKVESSLIRQSSFLDNVLPAGHIPRVNISHNKHTEQRTRQQDNRDDGILTWLHLAVGNLRKSTKKILVILSAAGIPTMLEMVTGQYLHYPAIPGSCMAVRLPSDTICRFVISVYAV